VSTLPNAAPVVAERGLSEHLRVFFDIARPRVMALVVFTGLPALLLGQSDVPSLAKAFWVLAGTALAGAASSALNAYFERDADARMARTRRRPLPAAVLLPRVVLAYGLLLIVVSTLILHAVGGWLAAFVGLATIAFYVGVYTLWLKPRTPQNIVIGGAAGATAPLIASAAMTGTLTLEAWVLFTIIFMWTPPHFWAIAIFRKQEYADAGFPMMPLVVGDQATRWRSLAYTLVLIPCTLIPFYLGDSGLLYAASATALGVWFLGHVVTSMRRNDPVVDYRVFKVSVAYLSLLFLMLLVDVVVQRVGA
jgi:protoheme IX farnesyltransferase